MKKVRFDSGMIADPAGILSAVASVIEAKDKQPVLVVSTMGSSGETLLKAGQRSSHQDVVLASTLAEGSRTYHMQIAQQVTSTGWPETKKSLSNLFDEISDLLKGIYLLGELTLRSEKVLELYGEGLAAVILAQVLEEKGCRSRSLFDRELLVNRLGREDQAVSATSEIGGEIHSLLAESIVPVIPASLARFNLAR